MAMEVVQVLQHLGHDHPLMLIKPEETDDSWDLSFFCYGCEEPISISSSSSSYYSCKGCMFFLHKRCAELPHEMTHPCHPQHPLTLLPNPPTADHSCDVCTKYCNRFIYRCSLCDYDIDLKCALEVLSIQIQKLGHDHPLMLIKPEEIDDSWDLSFFCDRCEEPISILSSSSSYYGCKRCTFFLHKTCAELPHEMTHPCHPQHPLTLLPKPPGAVHNCDVCTQSCNRFIYRCSLCDYNIDLKCAFELLSIQIQNLGHDHPLMLIKPEETDDSRDLSFFCYGCEEPISISLSSSYYGCKQCSFFLHKTCAELPHEMIHPCHPQHPLTLLPHPPRAVHKCDVCTVYCNGFIYCCSLCDFDIDLKCAFEVLSIQIQNLGHDHPLMLIKPEETEDSWDLSCYGCEQPILISSSSYYGCKRCRFFLHKSCAKLPHEMTHPSHPQHPLTLLPNPPPHYQASHAECDVCLEHFNRFTYHCSFCKYNIDLKCALEVQGIQMSHNHPSHAHQLIPLRKESAFLCDACGIQHKGTSYLCPTCGFWINQKCASSPLTLELNNHPHTLTLVYLVPQEEYLHARPHCQICSKRIYRRNWVYRCSGCHYYLAHLHCAVSDIHCAVSDKEHSTLTSALNNESENEIHDHGLNLINLSSRNSVTPTSDADLVIYLPMPDDSADIITQFIKNTAIQGKHKEAAKIKHGSHDHPLSLFEKPIDHAFLNSARKDEKCFGCTQSISAPFYHCDQCEFFLHVWCAELPEKLRHQGHPQHTLFLNKVHAQCACCRLSGNIFFYECIQSQCNFYLDCKCASLPRVIKHESHDKHTLALRPTSFSRTCTSCGVRLRISFECMGCNFNLCIRCAILPRTVRHRYDKHPFTLTYSPLPYLIEDDFCELCEEGIDSNRWFYHCGECDQYLHRDCILPVDEFSNIVYEQWINSRKHQHRLIYVKPNPNSSCSLCRRKNSNAKSYFCPPCGFRLCLSCTQKEIHDLCLNRIDLSSSNSATATLDADLYKVIYLPVPDDSADIISQFIKNTAIQGKKHKEEPEIKHDSHHHPLTLFEKPIDHALSPLNGARNDEKCNGCAQSISAPFYQCVICKFFLHVWCAELPEELRHPGHPQHTLFLSKVNHVTKCRCCNLVGNVFFYECTECDFVLDCKCASLPRVIKHESHDKHTLALRPTSFSSICTSCGVRLRISFECLGCKFNLCVRCAILPRTVWQRYDQFSNMVYAQWINSRKHQHRLISVKPNPNTSCSLCKRNNANADSYWCPPCGFRLCSSCRQKEIQGEN